MKSISDIDVSDYQIVDLGCGKNKVDDALGVDLRGWNDNHIEHDLDETPWPLPDNQFNEIYMRHSLEHLENWEAALQEIHRIATPNATIHIRVPHFSWEGTPDHETRWNLTDLHKTCTPGREEYIGVPFEVMEQKLHWRHHLHRQDHDRIAECNIFDPLGRLIDFFVNLPYVTPFANRLCYFFGGFEEIYWKACPMNEEVVK